MAGYSVTVYDATQWIRGVPKKVASVFGLDPAKVRVLSPYGGFGSKGSTWSHVCLAVIGAKVTKRPVKIILTCQQMFAFVGHRPQTIQQLIVAADASGKIMTLSHDFHSIPRSATKFSNPPHSYRARSMRAPARRRRIGW